MPRLLWGEDLETVSRGLNVTAATLTERRDAFLAAGEAALTLKPDSGQELEGNRLKAKLGAVLIGRDLLQENLLWVRMFETIDQLRQALLGFRDTDNATWLIERHGFITPDDFRQKQLQAVAKAA